MARDGIWKVEVKSDEAIKKDSRLNEDEAGVGFPCRFKTGEYVKDADTNEIDSPMSASNTNCWK